MREECNSKTLEEVDDNIILIYNRVKNMELEQKPRFKEIMKLINPTLCLHALRLDQLGTMNDTTPKNS